jgi:hypothetical protein
LVSRQTPFYLKLPKIVITTLTPGAEAFAAAAARARQGGEPVRHRPAARHRPHAPAPDLIQGLQSSPGDKSWSQSYDFGIDHYSASVVGSRLDRFFKVEETIFVFRTH